MSSKASLADPHGAWTLIRRLFREHGLVRWRRYLLAFVCMAIGAAATSLSAYLVGDVVNQAYINRNFPAIAALAGMIFILFAAKGFASYGQSVILARIGNAIVADNQRRVFDRLMAESVVFFGARHSSEFLARLSTGAAAASGVLNLLITAIGRDLLTLIGLLAVMIAQDPFMALVGFVVAPPALLVLRKLVKRIRSIGRNQFASNARILETVQEAIQGIRVVKAFTLEDEMRRRVGASIAEVEHAANKLARIGHRASPLMETLGGLAIALAILYGGYRVVRTGASPGEFFSFMAAFLLAYEPAKRLARLNIDLNNHLVGVRLLLELLDSPATEQPDRNRAPLVISAGTVTFDAVEFAYRADEPVLRQLSFDAPAGQTTALVGPSGGGKSTIFALLLRFELPDQGAIRIDGQDIGQISRASLRAQIAYVGQDAFLFRGTVGENIGFGRLGASEAEIVAAAKAANAHNFIEAFPHGYATPVGEHGLQLSGGQRQRIAIARALLKNAPIILLDEATASLDSESERLVQEAMGRLCVGRTTLVIAHRLNTIAHADMIHVVEAGVVTESGRHDELMRRGGRYASFQRHQLRPQDAAQEAHQAPVVVAYSG